MIGKDTPDFSFRVADELDAERIKARDLLFSGQIDQSVELAEAALERMDQLFVSNPGVHGISTRMRNASSITVCLLRKANVPCLSLTTCSMRIWN